MTTKRKEELGRKEKKMRGNRKGEEWSNGKRRR